MEHLRCVVERITYQNPQNGYTVIKVRVKNAEDLVTVVGAMPEVYVGSVLSLTGQWKMDAKYGRQFSMESFEETLPATAYGMEKYLGSGLIKGIGPKYARKIVDRFGADTLNVIEDSPEKLLEIPGIGSRRVESVRKSWQDQKEIRNIMLFLQSHNVSTSHATKIYKTYGNESIRVVTQNPYRLADDVWGIGFKTADTIASGMGFGKERYERLRSGVFYTLNQLSGEGHCYATRTMLIRSGQELLDVDGSLISMTLDEMIRKGDVITERLPEGIPEGNTPDREEGTPDQAGENSTGDSIAVYLPPFYYAESGTAKRLAAILNAEPSLKVNTRVPSQVTAAAAGVQYDDVQTDAIRRSVANKVLVLTGGPGTGKTTTTLGIITAFRRSGAKILLAAPTGRAARRLSEATGMEAKTIHRLLEYKPPEGYQRNEQNPLEGDVLILDECSMIDIMLMYSLLKAVPDGMRLILVGDVDQLPSVGAGNVLRDIIDSGCVPTVKLTRIFRQAQASRIILNAHRINSGRMPDLSNGRSSDFFFMEEEDPEKAVTTITELVKTKLSGYYHTPPEQIQVLTPMQRGVVGAANLNQALQQALNPEGDYLLHGGICYRVRDKVMQIRNNYDKDIFNGDIGIISAVDVYDRSLTVDFDGRDVEYDVSELDELVLAYATTIHKAQGSEYPIVVMPVLMNHFVMLQRNLIYTGVTRAKKILVMVGTRKALSYAVHHVTVTARNTLLSRRIVDAAGESGNPKCAPAGNALSGRTQMCAPDRTGGNAAADRENIGTKNGLRQDLFVRLSQSKFRMRFHLTEADRTYIQEKGMDTIRDHAVQIITKRLAPAMPQNDGKQTPMRGEPHGHPVFLAQHATGTCCRGCLETWHGIPKGRALTRDEISYIADVIMKWIGKQMGHNRTGAKSSIIEQ